MEKPDEFQELLLNTTNALEVQRSVETMQRLSPQAFGVMFGMDGLGHTPTSNQIDAAIDSYNALLDEWDDNARRTFGAVKGYELRQVESGRLAIARRMGQSSVWGPEMQEAVLTAEITPDSRELSLTKVTQHGKTSAVEAVNKHDRKILAMAILALLKITDPIEQ